LELWFFARSLPTAFKNREYSSWQSARAARGDPLWYTDAVIYELHARAFKDSNGDAIGDFPGLIQRLDYLQDLGVSCLWLLPFFPPLLKTVELDLSKVEGMTLVEMLGYVEFPPFERHPSADIGILQFSLARTATK
jgi:hypothetical protein